MKINYKPFIKFSNENKKRIFKFITLFRDLIEIHNDKIPFSNFEKKGFSVDEIPSFIEKINLFTPITDDTLDFLLRYRFLSQNSKEEFYRTFGIKPEQLEKTLYLKLYPNAIKNLDTIIKEMQKYISAETEKKQSIPKINLKSEQITYNDNDAVIKFNKQDVSLPPYKNEHFFCRAMYEHEVNEPIDWSIIYETITGYYQAYYGKPQQTRENWRLVYDTMNAVNKRIKNTINTNDNLFIWQEKTIKRNY